MSVALVWNSAAGNCAGLDAHDVRDRIQRASGHDVTIFDVCDARDPVVCAVDAITSGAGIVVAAGGDGTVSACAAELLRHGAGTAIALGVLPVGTSNSFAAALEIPGELDAAIDNLVAPHRRIIDAARVVRDGDERLMILHCMVGLHAETIEETSCAAKRRWGVLAYAATALKKLASLDAFAVELTTSAHVIRCRAVALAAANVAPLKTVLAHGPSHLLGDDGRVDVTIVAADTIAEAIATGVHLYRSGRVHEPATRDNVGSFSAAHVEIRTDPPQHVLVDGEPFGMTPVTIHTLPRALTVIAPPAGAALGDPIEAPLVGLPDLEIAPR